MSDPVFDILILGAYVVDGSGACGEIQDVGIIGDKIVSIGSLSDQYAVNIIDGTGKVLAPGFIDVHTHDDLEVVRNPAMTAKVSQGVSTVIVGNCGISATPYQRDGVPPDPINLLGQQHEFCFESLAHYRDYLMDHKPAVNVAALVGHTALRAQVLNDLSIAANDKEIQQMRTMLSLALAQGAIGLSTGLAYKNAKAAPSEEVEVLASELKQYGAIYTTHLRTEFDGIIDALDEAFNVAKTSQSPVVISHLKCAGKQNWGRANEVINHVKQAQTKHNVSCDSYPYHASSSTLDLAQVTDEFEIFITWSDAEPTMAGKSLIEIAKIWQLSIYDAAKRLMPAGAVYHGMSSSDVDQFIQFDKSMVGSDGLPCDPHPHPRLWGTFPRVLGHFCRDKQLMSLELAIHKMTGLSATNFSLKKRGFIRTGYFADLVLFDAKKIKDQATFEHPVKRSSGIEKLWVNGQLTFSGHQKNNIDCSFAGQFLTHEF